MHGRSCCPEACPDVLPAGEQALAVGADGGLAKPISLEALLERVQQEIGAP